MVSTSSQPARPLVGEIARFLVAGGSAVLTDFVVYFALLAVWQGMSPAVAKAVSFVAGAVVAFVLNRGFVFRADGGSVSRQVGRFAALYIVSLALNNAVNGALLHLGAVKALAWLGATASSTICNFVGMKLVVFRRSGRAES